MDLGTTEEQDLIRQSVRDFAAAEVEPFARQWDDQGALPSELFTKLATLGLFGLGVEERHGGSKLEPLSYVLCLQELAAASASVARALAAHVEASVLLADAEELLAAAASGELLLTWAQLGALTLSTEAESVWVSGELPSLIGGQKSHRVALVNESAGEVLLVDLRSEQVTHQPATQPLGFRAADPSAVRFERAQVQARVTLPAHALGLVELGTAAIALGAGNAALSHATSYAKERRQFGKPIADLQAIQWMLADSKTELDASSLLVLRAASGEDARAIAMAKLYATEAAARACSRALQVHGGYGYTRDYPIERHLRDCKACVIERGNDHARDRVAALILQA